MKLTYQGRKRLLRKKPSTFALSGARFPIHDKPHARNALARVSQALARRTVSASEAARVRAKAHRKLYGKKA